MSVSDASLLAEAEAEAVTEAARAFFADRHGLESRRTAGMELSRPGRLLEEAGELGFLGIGIDDEAGGSGGAPVDAGLLAEEAGAQLVHGALLHQLIAAYAFAQAGAGAERVTSLTSGRTPALVASGRGMTGSSGALLIPFADTPADVLVLGREGSSVDFFGSDACDIELQDGGWLLPLSSEGAIVLSHGPTFALEVAPSAEWGVRMFADGVVAMYVLGAARRLLEETVRYACERRQFGVPIATFQAVKHRLADASIGLIHARATVRGAMEELEASVELQTTPPGAAKLAADTAAWSAAEACLQVSGGYGFTWEADVHLVLKVILRLRQWPMPAASVHAELQRRLLGR